MNTSVSYCWMHPLPCRCQATLGCDFLFIFFLDQDTCLRIWYSLHACSQMQSGNGFSSDRASSWRLEQMTSQGHFQPELIYKPKICMQVSVGFFTVLLGRKNISAKYWIFPAVFSSSQKRSVFLFMPLCPHFTFPCLIFCQELPVSPLISAS